MQLNLSRDRQCKWGINLIVLSVLFGMLSPVQAKSGHSGHSGHGAGYGVSAPCHEPLMRCAKTMTAHTTKEGRIWFAWAVKKSLYVNYSDDVGSTYSPPVLVNPEEETIAARGENRPKIATDAKGNVYVSWVKKLPQKWTANIRFAWSADAGKHFSTPVTVNNDNEVTSHSFNEMVVSEEGVVTLAWLDGRHKKRAKSPGKVIGTSIYSARFLPTKEPIDNLRNIHQLNTSCVCCRLALTLNAAEEPVLMWRHIFEGGIRDHGMAVLTQEPLIADVHRVSFENWKIDGCPHKGPTLARQGKRLHMSWFSDSNVSPGLFYGHTDDEGVTVRALLNVAAKNTFPAHPDLSVSRKGSVQLVWTEFDGALHHVKWMESEKGTSWSSVDTVASFPGSADYPFLVQHPSGSYLLWHKPGEPVALILLAGSSEVQGSNL
ncbi:hypothetical protein A9Q99_11410 [Gammaproteobacteria bacterium 45_16_T64]|nr:hypothetical protein A9Q99_11410 [Gammaproteobacteria bacterium 45_16_T64]